MGAIDSIFSWLILKFVRLNPSSTIESLLPVGFAHVVHPHGFARSWGMDEFAVTDINTYVTEGSFQGVEENQVAGFEFTAFDFFCDLGLFLSPAGQ